MKDSNWQKIQEALLFSKNDIQDPRLGESVSLSLDSGRTDDHAIHIFGYPDDEGIQLNGGRVGAKLAPDLIRNYFYRMTPSPKWNLDNWNISKRIVDHGNLSTTTGLRDRHELAALNVQNLVEQNKFWLSFGGGHDYGYADGKGFLIGAHNNQALNNQKPIIINFDAHLDVRPDVNGANSGTPFFRLLNEFEDQFEFWQLGIQDFCNSPFHQKWCLDKKGNIVSANDLKTTKVDLFRRRQSNWNNRPIWISFDVDVVQQSEAPGCSQSWPAGISTELALSLVTFLFAHFNVIGLSIYEVSPPLDIDNRTAKLAANLSYIALNSRLEPKK